MKGGGGGLARPENDSVRSMEFIVEVAHHHRNGPINTVAAETQDNGYARGGGTQ